MSLIKSLDLQAVVDAKTDEELVAGLSEAESLQATPFEQLKVLRELAFPRLVEKIVDPDGLMHDWATRMEAVAESPTVVVKAGTPFAYTLPWLAAFAVIWKGEAPSHWPAAWTAEHVARALRWESGEQVPVTVSGNYPFSAALT